MSIRLPAERTGQTLVALLVTAIAHRVVEMPPRAGTTTWRVRTTVSAHSTILETENNNIINHYIVCTSERLSTNIISWLCIRLFYLIGIGIIYLVEFRKISAHNSWVRVIFELLMKTSETRMHSSRMRTVRNSSRLLLPVGGVPSPGRVPGPGGGVVSQHALRQTPL